MEALHGDKTQHERAEALARFKQGAGGGWHVLVATDVASRGLDIPSIKTVVSYDAAKRPEDHTHRIGRTGRAGAQDGTAYTLLTSREEDVAVEMVRSLLSASQAPAADLLALARRSRRWGASGLQKRIEGAGSNSGAGGGAGQPMALPPHSDAGDVSSAGQPAEFAPPQLYPQLHQQHRPPQHPPMPHTACAHQPPAPLAHSDVIAEARAKAQEMAARLSANRAAGATGAAPGGTAGLPLQPLPPPPDGPPPPRLDAQAEGGASHRRPSRWS